MINIKELRIGNLVYPACSYPEPIEVDLENISDFENLKPIPLTEEWKEKIKDNKFLFIDSQGFVIFKNSYSYAFVFEDYPFINQIQNLYFALTNEELKYEL